LGPVGSAQADLAVARSAVAGCSAGSNRADCWAAPKEDDRSVRVAQTDDSLRAAGDCPLAGCRADSVADDYSAPADCPAEADSPQGCSCPGARSQADFLLVDSLSDFRAEHSADYPDDFQPREGAAAVPAEP
jgi:hypothetical protein